MKHLVFGPGAMGFFMFLGVLSKLKKDGHLANLEEISGASAGALLGLLFCVAKGDTTRVLDFALEVPVKSIMKPHIKTLTTQYGLVGHSRIRKILVDFLQRDDMTFQELYTHFPVKLHVSAYCVDYMKTTYFSVDTTPHMSVIDAVCASIAIPFLFSSVRIGDANYIDGGAAEAVPGAPFLGRDDVMCVRFEWTPFTKIKDLKTYAISILYSTMNLRANYEYPGIELSAGDEIYEFGASSEDKLRMFLKGYEQAR